ncbi:MAG: hypothetical protein CME88_10070 [Hirschia sp.]|nr:hypothetical protein [Hirschia sp.]MBF18396.1 hypothetical protein [Hirschia sp.]MBF18713.1 hypothetical protein [Hirschia sp.]
MGTPLTDEQSTAPISPDFASWVGGDAASPNYSVQLMKKNWSCKEVEYQDQVKKSLPMCFFQVFTKNSFTLDEFVDTRHEFFSITYQFS